MQCKDCWCNDYKRTGSWYCMLPRCLYQVERGGEQDGGDDREAEKVLRPVHKTG